jgi:formate dehydrogenase gamma subunit
MPEYDYKKRNDELAKLNFRWAATVGAGFGSVAGKVAAGEQPVVTYDKSRFDADGNVVVHMAPEPRNETCLNCHAKPGWKKRGASFSARTDVHMKAGLRCVDCHAAGSGAVDPRIQDWETHQFGKGDDPSGNVRNDLDNTVRSCESCHLEGWYNAPIAKHGWLPPLHLQKIACQTCHIPQRAVNSAMVQASDVYNPAPRISPPPKHIWTFYDQQMRLWNHYGDLDLFTVKDQPTDTSRPMLARYKGIIYPANRVHSTWVGFEQEGKPGLNQLFMRDFFMMWKEHGAAPETAYPELRKVTDDNGDGMPEVNRPEEIDALLGSVREYLTKTGFDLTGKRLVWVCDDRAYSDGTTWRQLPKEPWEASPYASVYKYSHDVAPARAALGIAGCTDCHDEGSDFFFASSVQLPFSDEGRPIYIPQAELLGTTTAMARLGAWRESALKPASPWVLGALLVLLLLHYVTFGPRRVREGQAEEEVPRYTRTERVAHLSVMACFAFLFLTGGAFLFGINDPLGPASRFMHKVAGMGFAAVVLVMVLLWERAAWFRGYDRIWFARLGGYFSNGEDLPAGKFNAGQKVYFWVVVVCIVGLAGTGAVMGFGGEGLRHWLPIAYTLHDTLALIVSACVLGHVYLAVLANPGSLKAIMIGKVSRSWALHHHSKWLNELDQGSGKRK